MSDVWSEFTADPRVEGNATLRAGDADRDVVRRVLSAAYAEGRIDREELDERSDLALAARTIAELPELIDDLIVTSALAPSSPTSLVSGATDASVEQRATQRWEGQRRQALWAMLSASAICWAIWLMAGMQVGWGIPWPLWVTLGTGLNLGRTQFMREEIIGEERTRLERKPRAE
ncbi:MAG: DUF1707 domain-containing protein [Nocardioides sp.]|nr:DUF1707 domain-containing protein [Nocardioides sp.]